MKRMFVFILFAATGILFPQDFNFRWPVDDNTITATFGESRSTHFHNGIDIGGGEQNVYPVDDGEVVYYFEEGNSPGDIPTGLGNFIVVEHGKEVRSVYCHLKKNSILKSKYNVEKTDCIGLTGSTGFSKGIHLHFSLIDLESGSLINPLLFLPKYVDRVSPHIGRIYAVRNGKKIELKNGMSISPGKVRITAEIYDRITLRGMEVSPYRIVLKIGKKVVVDIVYDLLKRKNGKTVLSGVDGVFFKDFYTSGKISEWEVSPGILNLKKGRVELEISVWEFSRPPASFNGKKSVKTVSLIVSN